MFIAGCAGYANRDWLGRLFAPPQVELREAYQPHPQGKVLFDADALAQWDALLKKHVDDDGFIDYAGFREDASQLDAYLNALEAAPFAAMGRDEKLATLINAYNAFTIKLILDHMPTGDAAGDWGIKSISAAERWDAKRWNLGGQVWSLNQIEHEQVRPKFKEPRIHFALVCAAVGCPPLRNEAFTVAKLEQQLAEQTAYVHRHKTWLAHDKQAMTVNLTQLYNWYGNDFAQLVGGDILDYVKQHDATVAAMVEQGDVRVAFLPYDWSLNSQANRQSR